MKTNQKKRRTGLGVAQLNVEVPLDLHQGLKIIAAIERKSVKQIAQDALADLYQSRRKDTKLSFLIPELQSLGNLFCAEAAA